MWGLNVQNNFLLKYLSVWEKTSPNWQRALLLQVIALAIPRLKSRPWEHHLDSLKSPATLSSWKLKSSSNVTWGMTTPYWIPRTPASPEASSVSWQNYQGTNNTPNHHTKSKSVTSNSGPWQGGIFHDDAKHFPWLWYGNSSLFQALTCVFSSLIVF